MLKDCSKKPNAPWVDVPARLEALLARVRQLRQNLYPPGWDADPLYEIEQELEKLLNA